MSSRRSALAAIVGLALVACGGGTPDPRQPAGKASGPDDPLTLQVRLASQRFTLPNGLVVVLHREPSARSAHVRLEYDVGSKDDPVGRAGLAHLFEHLMFEPTRHGDGKDVNSVLETLSAQANASTSHDVTTYYADVPAAELGRVLWLEADRMAYPAVNVTDASLARERDVVVNEWRERYENEPYGHVWAAAYRELFGSEHPYALPPIGLPEELAKVTLDDVRAFARQHYRPNHATLVVCGAFDPAATRALVERWFGTIPPGAPVPTRTVPAPRLPASRTLTIAADVPAPMVAMAWPAPPVHGDGYEELALGMDVLEGRLGWSAVTDRKLATSVSLSLTPHRLGSVALLRVRLRPDVSPSSATSAVEDEIARVGRLGDTYTFEGFGDLKTRFMVSEVRELEQLDERASALLHGVRWHRQPDAVQEDLRRWQAVRLADMGGAVRQVLGDQPRLTVIVKPTKGAPRAGRVVR